jgi:dihydrofolate reductase
MRPLRYSINITLDGCCDHRAIIPDPDLHRHAMETLQRADALIFGRIMYQMMEAAWRQPDPAALQEDETLAASARPARPARPGWMEPFALTIDAAKKYVVSSTLTADRVTWNAELLQGELGPAVERLKQQPGKGLYVAGLQLPLALAGLGLIDEYELIVHPRLAGHGPTLMAGLRQRVDLKLVGRREFASGAVALRYEPKQSA